MKLHLNLLTTFLCSAGMMLLTGCGNSGSGTAGNADTAKTPAAALADCSAGNPCFQPDKCNDAMCQDNIVACHNITSIRFDTLTLRSARPTHATYTVASIKSIMAGLDCTNGDFIEFTDNDGKTEIQLKPMKCPCLRGKYSIAFYAGLFRQYKPGDNDIIELYKGVDDAGGKTAAMKLIVGGATVYFGDLTELYP